MDTALALDLARDALLLALVISGPVLGIGLVVGVVISLGQAVTQIQDQTLAMVPKIIAMVVATFLAVPWVAQRIIEYTRELLAGQ